MPKFTRDEVEKAMEDLPNVRNVGMIGPMGTGKTCAMDCIGAQCGMLSEDKIGLTRFTLMREDEIQKGCTIKSSLHTLLVDDVLLHCVDTPGHSEYVQELQIVTPLVDGALYIVDGSKGELAAQSKGQIDMLNNKLITPVLFCNSLDTALLVTKKPAEEILDNLTGLVTMFNDGQKVGAPCVSAEKGSVLFGSLKNGWAFSIPQMASVYSKKFGSDVETMATRLWAQFFNAKKKTWCIAQQDGNSPGFVQLVLNPILKILEAAENGDVDKLEKMLMAMGVTMMPADKKFEGIPLFHRAMQLWMPAGKAIVSALKQFVPNPIAAQALRFPVLVSGPETDLTSMAVRDCNKKGTMLFQAVKLVPAPASAGRFFAMGRVWSGSLVADKCFVLEEDFIPQHATDAMNAEAAAQAEAHNEAAKAEAPPAGSESPGGDSPGAAAGGGTPSPKATPAKKNSSAERRIQGVVTVCGKTFPALTNPVPAGNLCAVSGIDQFIMKRATLAATMDSWPLMKPTITVSPVVRQAVQPCFSSDLPKMVEALRRLSKTCPIVQVTMETDGKHVVAAGGQEHMRVLKGDLEGDYLAGIEVKWDDPSITYRETVTTESSQTCLAKSPNKHNRLFLKAEPLEEAVNLAIEAGRVFPNQDQKVRAKLLKNEYSWDQGDGMKIWSFGPAPEEASGNYGANVLVDQTKAVQYLNEIKESVNSGLLWASRQGPLSEEPMRGIRFNLMDVKLHADSIHRGMGQIQPTARRVLFAATLMGECRFQEPIFSVTIVASKDAQPGIMQALGVCRGEFQTLEENGAQILVNAFVPIAETIGKMPFTTVLTQKTNGKATANYAFDHWDTMPSDPLNIDKDGSPTGRAAEILLDIRRRKGLKVEKPQLFDYLDKL